MTEENKDVMTEVQRKLLASWHRQPQTTRNDHRPGRRSGVPALRRPLRAVRGGRVGSATTFVLLREALLA